MSDLLVHWAVFDDCRRLAAVDANVLPALAGLLRDEETSARLGALSRGGHRFVPHLLGSARERGVLGREAAFALGGLLHYPADLMMKPLQRRLAAAEAERLGLDRVSVREVSAYYDTHVFRRVYADGHEAPFSRFLLTANETSPGQALEAFVQALFQRSLLASHTLSPDFDDLDGWLANLLDRVQPLYVDLGLYARVYAEPDPEKMAFYEVETSFYRDDDPIVRAAREARRVAPVAAVELSGALAEGANQGAYGQAVALGLRCLRQVSDWWRGDRADLPEVRQ